eukprot:1145949-Pelagomonas_calceolata.AAC.4
MKARHSRPPLTPGRLCRDEGQGQQATSHTREIVQRCRPDTAGHLSHQADAYFGKVVDGIPKKRFKIGTWTVAHHLHLPTLHP